LKYIWNIILLTSSFRNLKLSSYCWWMSKMKIKVMISFVNHFNVEGCSDIRYYGIFFFGLLLFVHCWPPMNNNTIAICENLYLSIRSWSQISIKYMDGNSVKHAFKHSGVSNEEMRSRRFETTLLITICGTDICACVKPLTNNRANCRKRIFNINVQLWKG